MKKALSAGMALLLFLTVFLSGCRRGKEISVSFNANYQGAPAIASVSVQEGQKLTPPEDPTRPGYDFLGWFQDPGLTTPWDLDADHVDEPVTLYAGWDRSGGADFAEGVQDRDFSGFRTPEMQEDAYEYQSFFRPDKDGDSQPYVGDVIPYYENGTFYLYYLKDGGDSYNHSVYLVTTTDFNSYIEYDNPILSASRAGGQESYLGSGSVVKAADQYLFFYTARTDALSSAQPEAIHVAVSSSLTSFQRNTLFELTPPEELGPTTAFRDPQASWNPATGNITLIVSTSQGTGTAGIVRFTLDRNLNLLSYDGTLFRDRTDSDVLSAPDCFTLNGRHYLMFTDQTGAMWYAEASSPYGIYHTPQRLEGRLFCNARPIPVGEDTYLIGWVRRADVPSSSQEIAGWGGNLAVQKLTCLEDGTLLLEPAEKITDKFNQRRTLPGDNSTHVYVDGSAEYAEADALPCYESFLITGEFRYTGTGTFGLVFEGNSRSNKNKYLSLDPANGKAQFLYNERDTLISESSLSLSAGTDHSFTYLQEGSVGMFYLDGQMALTIRVYGTTGKTIRFFAEDNTVLFSSLRQYTRG